MTNLEAKFLERVPNLLNELVSELKRFNDNYEKSSVPQKSTTKVKKDTTISE